MKFQELNKSFRKFLRDKKLLNIIENLQMMAGVFGILYGLIFTLYFYVKVNKSLSLLFFCAILIGIFLLISTRRAIINDQEREDKYPI